MEIKFINEENGSEQKLGAGTAQQISRCSMTRFIVIEREGCLGVTLHPHFAGEYVTHEKYAAWIFRNLPDAKFVGAGYYYPRRGQAKFDSDTCIEVFGFDRPEDEDLQKEILEKIQEYLIETT